MKKILTYFTREREEKTIPSTAENIIESVRFVLTVVVLWLIIRIFIMQPFLVDGASMSPNFETGHYLIVDKISYRFTDPERGEVIVFKFPFEDNKYFVKRIIGVPGDTVEILQGKTKITDKNGVEISFSENFVTYTNTVLDKKIKLRDGEYFVMGDNRAQSYDSRSWGPLEKKYINGHVLLRLYPFSQINVFPASLSRFN